MNGVIAQGGMKTATDRTLKFLIFLCAFASEMGRLHVDVCMSVGRAQATRATVSRARISTNVS